MRGKLLSAGRLVLLCCERKCILLFTSTICDFKSRATWKHVKLLNICFIFVIIGVSWCTVRNPNIKVPVCMTAAAGHRWHLFSQSVKLGGNGYVLSVEESCDRMLWSAVSYHRPSLRLKLFAWCVWGANAMMSFSDKFNSVRSTQKCFTLKKQHTKT